MSADNGGPAFPVSTAHSFQGHQDGPNTWQFPGMTLRDYFAAKAMESALDGASAGDESLLPELMRVVARRAYMAADAMLEERAK